MILHLVRRFFGSIPGRPPNVGDEVWAEGFLVPGERSLWVRSSNRDRRHAIDVAKRFAGAADRTRDEMAAALLHDIGKIESGLSTWERVGATLFGARTTRWRAYRDHESIGLELCRRAGSSERTLAVLADPRDPAARDLRAADDIRPGR